MDWDNVDILSLKSLDFNSSFSLAKYVSHQLFDDLNRANETIIKVLEIWDQVDESTRGVWIDLIDSAGFYPYLSNVIESSKELDNTTEIRKAFHTSHNLENITFHKEQKKIADLIKLEKNIIVSAPTSFGKSLLIQEIIALDKYKNILIIQPTLALINETRINLKKFSKNYNVIVNTSQEMGNKNIFILTAERVLEFENMPNIDYCILDEFYKLSSLRDDERSDILNIAVKKVLELNPNFYFIGPNIDAIPTGFVEKYNAEFFKTNYSLVNTNIVKINTEGKSTKDKELLLFDLLRKKQDEQSIVYVSSPGRAYSLAKKYYDYLIESGFLKEPQSLEISEWIEENLSKEWSFNNLIKYSIGVHSGVIPKHLVHSMVEYFNEGKIDVLFCTATIIEGVNTSAKNVIIFDNKKGNELLDFFDFSNIKGRAGRLLKHYTGNVYVFHSEPSKEHFNLDIPFYDQKLLHDEILINLIREEVHKKHLERYDELNSFDSDYLAIIKKNAVSVEGQKEIINKLQIEINRNPKLVIWTGFPNYDQIKFIMNLAWENLLKYGEATRPMTQNKLPVTVLKHANKDVHILIKEEAEYLRGRHLKWEEQQIIDKAIENVFREQRHWISYKVPKWLNVVNSLQKVVCQKAGLWKSGDYTFFSSFLENENLDERFFILIDLGIPSSVIPKITKFIPKELYGKALIEYLRELSIEDIPGILSYEIKKLRQL